MSFESRVARILDHGPTPWAMAITVYAVPGIFALFVPFLVDRNFGDGAPAGWVRTGSAIWVAGFACLTVVAVLGGYWLPRLAGVWRKSLQRDQDDLGQLGLLGTAWGSMLFLTVWSVLALKDDSPWAVVAGFISLVMSSGTLAYIVGRSVAEVRRIRRRQRPRLAARRGRR